MSAIGISRICLAAFALGVVHVASAQPVLDGSFDAKLVPVYKSRIFRVPDDTQTRALTLLQNGDFLRLTERDLSRLFPSQRFDTEQMLRQQALVAEAWATKREEQAADPFFATHKAWMLDEARSHRAYAQYTRALSTRLVPYLIAAKVYSEQTGAFFVKLGTHELFVAHASLGRTAIPERRVAVVIFVEHQVKRVSISGGTAQ